MNNLETKLGATLFTKLHDLRISIKKCFSFNMPFFFLIFFSVYNEKRSDIVRPVVCFCRMIMKCIKWAGQLRYYMISVHLVHCCVYSLQCFMCCLERRDYQHVTGVQEDKFKVCVSNYSYWFISIQKLWQKVVGSFKIKTLIGAYDRQHWEPCDVNICGRKAVKLKILALLKI